LALGRVVVAVAAVVGTLALATSSVAVGAALDQGSRLRTSGATLPPVRAAALAALTGTSERLGTALAARFPGRYGGLVVNTDATITVYVTRMPHDLADVVRAVAPSSTVRVVHGTNSLAALQGVQQALARGWLALQDRGIDVVGFSPDVARSTVLVQVIDPTPSQVAYLDAVYGAERLTVQAVATAPIPSGFVSRVGAEPHGSFPWDAVPIVAGVEGAILAAIALLAGRRPRRRTADALAERSAAALLAR
jgi:hypothetical protein